MSGFKRIDKRGAPEWLYGWHNARGELVSYWVRYRKDGIKLEQKIQDLPPEPTWIEARAAGQELVDQARGAKKLGKEAPSLVRSEDVCNELVELKKAKAPATYEQTEIFMRKHLIPFFNQFCPYAGDFDSTVWERYKAKFRIENPQGALFNHWKFFVMFSKHAFEQGILKKRFKLAFDELREDRRERGHVIPPEHFALLYRHAKPIWKDRMLIQVMTGMRPGEVRCLRRDRVTMGVEACIIKLRAEDTKTRMAREFKVTDPDVLDVLRLREQAAKGPYLFQSRLDPQRPLERGLKGWGAILARANKALEKEAAARNEKFVPLPAYTPHDIRHTWLTHMFKTATNPALICYYAGLSIEEAQKTYLHFKAGDTDPIADAAQLVSSIGKSLGSDVAQTEVIVDK